MGAKINTNTMTTPFFILLAVVGLTWLALRRRQQQTEGFNYNFFPPPPYRCKEMDIKTTVLPDTANVLFSFPPDTPKDIMLDHVAHMFKNKANLAFTNIINVKVRARGGAPFLYVQLTKPRHISQMSARLLVPLFFTPQGVVAKVDKRSAPPEIDYFLHHFFDPFYCAGQAEQPSLLAHTTGTDAMFFQPYDLVVQTTKMTPADNAAPPPLPLSIEPDTPAHTREYETPATISEGVNEKSWEEKWDGRGVPIEKTQNNIIFKQFINHPALYQAATDGLYDDMFDLSRLIPSFPTGRSSGGR
jgi:hypothetical protein